MFFLICKVKPPVDKYDCDLFRWIVQMPLEPRSEKYEDLGKVRYSNVFRGKSELKKSGDDFDMPF